MKTIELPEMGLFSWVIFIIIVLFLLGFIFISLWGFRNYQEYEKNNTGAIENKKIAYHRFVNLTSLPIFEAQFVNLNKDVIDALFNIYAKGYVSESDFAHIDLNFYLPDYESDWPERMRLMKDKYHECRNKYLLHKKNNMVFSADNFFHTFFGINK